MLRVGLRVYGMKDHGRIIRGEMANRPSRYIYRYYSSLRDCNWLTQPLFRASPPCYRPRPEIAAG
jgi:hypothetical protein